MPIYVYECLLCGIIEELDHPMSAVGDPVLHCATPMNRQFVPTPAIFRGGGWGKDKK
jgi:predicted nucleic acid-binding Zn ribbon protein